MAIVTMSQTVGELTNGQTYIVRAREADLLIAQSKATRGTTRGASGNVLPAKTGKRGQ